MTGELGAPLRVPFHCHSWRHQGDCRRWIAAQNFSRISEALSKVQSKTILLAVLTLKPSDWKDRWEAFADLSSRWRSLRKAITRDFGANDWVATVEIHKSGWPHLNVVLVCPKLADTRGNWRLAWLKRHAVACGFGPIASIERAKSKQAVAGYVVKVAGETDSGAPRTTVGETVKLSQLPVNAPPHFRRLRSSKKFLPPARKGNTPMLGKLERFPLPPDQVPADRPLPTPPPHLSKEAWLAQQDPLDVGRHATGDPEQLVDVTSECLREPPD